MLIEFYSKVKTPTGFNHRLVSQIISKVVKSLKIKPDFEITVLLVGDHKIKTLNKKYRNKNQVTDVLSFSQKEGIGLVLPSNGKSYLGDIVICYPQIVRQSKKYGHSVKKEFNLLLVHGFLHLLSYDDKTEKGRLQMEKLQDKILL